MTLAIDVQDETGRVSKSSLAWLQQNIERAAEWLGASGEIRVKVVADPAMARAHEEFAGVEGTTDVLTFDMSDPEQGDPPAASFDPESYDFVRTIFKIDTDILICLDEAERQSAPHGYPFDRELLLYVVHGMLHCLGFDDHEDQDFAVMHALEDRALAAIGVGPVFHRPREA